MLEKCSIKNMSIEEIHDKENEWIKLMLTLLTSLKLPEDLKIDPALTNNPDFKKLYNFIIDLRELSSSLAKGDLQTTVPGKGYILSNLKALQSNLRHLTWQSKMVSQGDFSQKVDFLGEFSDAFNEMTAKLQNSSMQLFRMATIDTLTQIPNRRALTQFLSDSFKISVRNNTQFSIIIFDIDFFKNVNDNYGHDTGDVVLIKVSEILNTQFRSNDMFSRYGGEEFMAVLPGTGIDNAFKIAERAIKLVEKEAIYINDNLSISMTVSAGASCRLDGDKTYEDIIKRSDKALYEAKRSGKNRVCVV